MRSSKKMPLDVELLARDAFPIVFPITIQAFQLTFGLLFLSEFWTMVRTLPPIFSFSAESNTDGMSTYARKKPRARSALAETLKRSELAKLRITMRSFFTLSCSTKVLPSRYVLNSLVACEERT